MDGVIIAPALVELGLGLALGLPPRSRPMPALGDLQRHRLHAAAERNEPNARETAGPPRALQHIRRGKAPPTFPMGSSLPSSPVS